MTVTVNLSTELPAAPMHKVVESSSTDTEQPTSLSASLPSCKEKEKVGDITEQLLLIYKFAEWFKAKGICLAVELIAVCACVYFTASHTTIIHLM